MLLLLLLVVLLFVVMLLRMVMLTALHQCYLLRVSQGCAESIKQDRWVVILEQSISGYIALQSAMQISVHGIT